MNGTTKSTRVRLFGISTLLLVIVSAVGCTKNQDAASSSPSNETTVSASASATGSVSSAQPTPASTTATTADGWLNANKYGPAHLPPRFSDHGKIDLGYNATLPYKYAAAYTYTGNSASFMQNLLTGVQQKLKSTNNNGVSVTYAGNVFILQAGSVHDFETGITALIAALKS